MGKRGGRGGGGGGGGGPGNKRTRDVDDDDASGPSKAKLRGLSYTAAQPAFLRNAMAALQGPKPPTPAFDSHGRPAIPERPSDDPNGDAEEEDQSDEDRWDMGRGEEAPAVVVLNEGKHLGREEVDRLRAAAKADFAQDPLASSSAPAPKSKLAASLNFSSSTAANPTQRRLADGEELPSESWEDVIKRSKVEAEVKKLAKEVKERDEKLEKEKKEKAKKKEKKVQAKKQSMLSFGGDE